MDLSKIVCRYCNESGYQSPYQHERACTENPDNMPALLVMFKCGHQGEHKPFPNDPDFSKLRAFLKERECQDCFLAAYREAQANMSEEAKRERMLEARAAHGPGVELVNVITGERYTT